MVEEIRVKTLTGLVVGDDEETGETDVTVLDLTTEDGRHIALRIPREHGLQAIVALMAGLSAATASSTSYRVAIPAVAWQIEAAEQGAAILHAFLGGDQAARLSFDLNRDHVRPLAEQLRLHADRMDARPNVSQPPPSASRN